MYPKAVSRLLEGKTDWFFHAKYARAVPIGRLRVRIYQHTAAS